LLTAAVLLPLLLAALVWFLVRRFKRRKPGRLSLAQRERDQG
jgi:hypothetical protein